MGNFDKMNGTSILGLSEYVFKKEGLEISSN